MPLVVGADATANLKAAPPDVRRLIRDHRYFDILSPQEGIEFDDASVSCAWQAVEQQMALVPQGQVSLQSDQAVLDEDLLRLDSLGTVTTPVEAFYMDRTAVTNADFQRFVDAGCYSRAELWPEDVLPSVLLFTDQTGKAGPRYWSGGEPAKNKRNHPVVGICWYEANAYAQWLGKQLPTAAQWQRAGTWGRSSSKSNMEVHYPWGNSFDPTRANLWASGNQQTVEVTEFAEGDTPNGVRQLIGNVWEWINNAFVLCGANGLEVAMRDESAEIRGGAFDTYFHAHATCQFRSGQALTYRGNNIGFRCCRGLDGLTSKPSLGDAS